MLFLLDGGKIMKRIYGSRKSMFTGKKFTNSFTPKNWFLCEKKLIDKIENKTKENIKVNITCDNSYVWTIGE